MATPPDGYVTTSEAAVRVGVARSTIYRWVDAGLLPRYRHPLYGRGLLIKVDELDDLARAAPEPWQPDLDELD